MSTFHQTAFPIGVTVSGNVAQAGSTQVNNVNVTETYTSEDFDRDFIRIVRWPDTLAIKNRLKQSKDRLLPQVNKWLFETPEYLKWYNEDVDLLWLKGGAGKGKTMMSIGIIEWIINMRTDTTAITYFHCQDPNDEQNTIESMLRGLIRRLISERSELKEILRKSWDHRSKTFTHDLSSWQSLWEIFVEILDVCKCEKIYIIIDALDECRNQDMARFLRQLVRTGLSNHRKFKWFLTSRPLDSAEQELAVRSETSGQTYVSLELHTQKITEGVGVYIASKIQELSLRHNYPLALQAQAKQDLENKAENTFLWVALVCKELENEPADTVLNKIAELPPGLHSLYQRALEIVGKGNSDVAKYCFRLLKVMTLVHRPLSVHEIQSVTGLSHDRIPYERVVDRCASFVKLRESRIEIVHQSVLDYLKSDAAQNILDAVENYKDQNIALSCLSFLSQHLKVDLLGLKRPDAVVKDIDDNDSDTNSGVDEDSDQGLDSSSDTETDARSDEQSYSRADTWDNDWGSNSLSMFGGSTPESFQDLDKSQETLLTSLDYAANFWVRHARTAQNTTAIQDSLVEGGAIESFLRSFLLEWIECLGWLNRLSDVSSMIDDLIELRKSGGEHLSTLITDFEFLFQQSYGALTLGPLQVYSMFLHFSPCDSLIRKLNTHKLPPWLEDSPVIQNTFSPHRLISREFEPIRSIALSPRGDRLVSSTGTGAIRLWDMQTFESIRTQEVQSRQEVENVRTPELRNRQQAAVLVVAFSSDEKYIAAGSKRGTIEIWTSDLRTCLSRIDNTGKGVDVLCFSTDSEHLVSVNQDGHMCLWEVDSARSLQAFSTVPVCSAIFLTNGQFLIAGHEDGSISLWKLGSNSYDLVQTIPGYDWSSDGPKNHHDSSVTALAFSNDMVTIASGDRSGQINIWRIDRQGVHLRDAIRKRSWAVKSLAFSPDCKWLVSGQSNKDVVLFKVQDEGVSFERTFVGHFLRVRCVAFSVDSKRIISSSQDCTIRIWDIQWPKDRAVQMATPSDETVVALAMTHDSRLLISISRKGFVRMWSAATGILLNTIMLDNMVQLDYGVPLLLIAPDDKRFLMVRSNEDNTNADIEVWHIEAGLPQLTKRSASILVKKSSCEPVFSPDGKFFALAASPYRVLLYSSDTGEVHKWFVSRLDTVRYLTFSPDGKQLATKTEDGQIRVWNPFTGRCLHSLERNIDWPEDVAFSNDGAELAVLSSFWDLETPVSGGQFPTSRSGPPVFTIGLYNLRSSDGRRRFGGIGSLKKLAASGIIAYHIGTHHNLRTAPRYSENDTHIITRDGAIRIPDFYGSDKRKVEAQLDDYGMLDLNGRWVCCGSIRVCRLPQHLVPESWIICSRGDHLAVACTDGQILKFTIDHRKLASIMGRKSREVQINSIPSLHKRLSITEEVASISQLDGTAKQVAKLTDSKSRPILQSVIAYKTSVLMFISLF